MGALEQKVAVITGATSGIGAAMAALFAAERADVVIAGRRREEGAETLDAAFVATDVTVESDVEALVGYAVDRFGRLDVMVNNSILAIAFVVTSLRAPLSSIEPQRAGAAAGVLSTMQQVGTPSV